MVIIITSQLEAEYTQGFSKNFAANIKQIQA